MNLLNDKVILITGASRGIGRAMALSMAKHGAEVIINSRSIEDLKIIEEEIKSNGWREPFLLPYDVSDINAMQRLFSENRNVVKRINVLINNAGIMETSLLGTITTKNALKVMETNCLSAIYHMQLLSRFMIKNKEGSIINIGSIVGDKGAEGQTLYSASKAGIVGATLSAAKELAPFNIRVNAISPGIINTDLISALNTDELIKTIKNVKLGRIGEPDDISNVALFLASSLSSYVTGQVIGVDGGLVL